MANRVQLNEEQLDDVVGGAFNFYYNDQGAKSCYVDGVGDYKCSSDARDRLTALKMLHRKDHWSASQYVDQLLDEGLFW